MQAGRRCCRSSCTCSIAVPQSAPRTRLCAPVRDLRQALWPERPLCVNVQRLSLSTTHVNGQLHSSSISISTVTCEHVGFASMYLGTAASTRHQAALLELQGTTHCAGCDCQTQVRTWHVTHSVWHSCVLPLLNSPYSSVMEPVSMPPGKAHTQTAGAATGLCQHTVGAQPCEHAFSSMLALSLHGGAAAPSASTCWSVLSSPAPPLLEGHQTLPTFQNVV